VSLRDEISCCGDCRASTIQKPGRTITMKRHASSRGRAVLALCSRVPLPAALPGIMHHPRALPQGNARHLASAPRPPDRSPRPPQNPQPPRRARRCCRLCRPRLSTRKAKCVLVFMDKSDSTCPGPLVFIPHVVASRSLPRLLRALLAQPSREAPRWGRVLALTRKDIDFSTFIRTRLRSGLETSTRRSTHKRN
jgi:hypothetical protein